MARIFSLEKFGGRERPDYDNALNAQRVEILNQILDFAGHEPAIKIVSADKIIVRAMDLGKDKTFPNLWGLEPQRFFKVAQFTQDGIWLSFNDSWCTQYTLSF